VRRFRLKGLLLLSVIAEIRRNWSLIPEVPHALAVLALDYDNTIATDGSVADSTARALRRIRESGRKLVLVTGRIISDLIVACDVIPAFAR
jgi:hypothetical protein